MIYATGTILGKEYDFKPVKMEDVIKHFNVPFKKGVDVEFQLAKHLQRVDKLNGGIRRRPYSMEPTRVSGFDKQGNSVELLFTTTVPTVNPKTGQINSSPKSYMFSGTLMVLNQQQIEQALLFYLNPKCRQSPFNKNGAYEWELLDREADARKELDEVDVMSELIAEIRSETNIRSLLRIAKGLKFASKGSTVTIPSASINEAEVKARLIKLAMEHTQAFSVAYRDGNTRLYGLLKDGIDSGVIVLKNVGGGMSKYYLNSETDNGEVCTVNNGADPLQTLFNAAQDYNTYARIVTAVDGNFNSSLPQTVAQLLHADNMGIDFSDMSGQQLVTEALGKGIVEFDREKSTFYLVNPDGERQLQGLHKVEVVANRNAELALALDTVKIKKNRVVKALKGERSEEESNKTAE